MNLKLLQQLITIYLELNPKPKDEQVHNLAFSINLTKETLEEVMYQMMSDHVTAELLTEPVSEFTNVLEDNYDPNLTTLTDLASNDGDTNPNKIQNMQDILHDDGIGPEDAGLGISVADLTLNDGSVIVDLSNRIKSRLL